MTLFRHRRKPDRDRYRIAGARAASLTRGSGPGLMAPSRAADGSAPHLQRFDAARQGTLAQHQLRQADDQHRMGILQGRAGLRERQQRHQHAGDRHQISMKQGLMGLRRDRERHEWERGTQGHAQWQRGQEREQFEGTAGLRRTQQATAEVVTEAQNLLARASSARHDPDGGMTLEIDGETRQIPAGTVMAMGMQGPDRREEMMQQHQRQQYIQGMARRVLAAADQEGGNIDALISRMSEDPTMDQEIRRAIEPILVEQKKEARIAGRGGPDAEGKERIPASGHLRRQGGRWAGALTGAGIGAGIGTLKAPGPGTIIGGLVGGVSGFIGGGRLGKETRQEHERYKGLRSRAQESGIDPGAVEARQEATQEAQAAAQDVLQDPHAETSQQIIRHVLATRDTNSESQELFEYLLNMGFDFSPYQR